MRTICNLLRTANVVAPVKKRNEIKVQKNRYRKLGIDRDVYRNTYSGPGIKFDFLDNLKK